MRVVIIWFTLSSSFISYADNQVRPLYLYSEAELLTNPAYGNDDIWYKFDFTWPDVNCPASSRGCRAHLREVVTKYKRLSKIRFNRTFTTKNWQAVSVLADLVNKELAKEGSFLKQESAKQLLATYYRILGVFAFHFGQYHAATAYLERYIDVSPEYEAQASVHAYLFAAYRFKLKMLEQQFPLLGSEQEILFYKKNLMNTICEPLN